MKYRKSYTLLLAVLLIGTTIIHLPGFAQNKSKQSDSAAVAQLIYDWLDALKTRDVSKLERIMAEDFVTTNVDGSVNSKESEISPFKSPDLVFDSAYVENLRISVYGTTAIVRGTGTFIGKYKLRTFASKEQFTEVFLKRRGKWQAVSSHSSLIRRS